MKQIILVVISLFNINLCLAQLNNIEFKIKNKTDTLFSSQPIVALCKSKEKSKISYTIGLQYFDTLQNEWFDVIENIFCKTNCLNTLKFKKIRMNTTKLHKFTLINYSAFKIFLKRINQQSKELQSLKIRFYIINNPTLRIEKRKNIFIEKKYSDIFILKI